MKAIKTQEELIEKLGILGIEDEEKRNKVVCALIGHSKIQHYCFGYYTCARCGEQVGDSLGSLYPDAEKAVIVGHNCPACKENFEKLTWEDKAFCPDPFETDETVRTCRVCGCTDDHACPGGCWWIDEDLCSECVGKE